MESYFKAIDGNTPCNIALLLGHCSARASVAGDGRCVLEGGILDKDVLKTIGRAMRT